MAERVVLSTFAARPGNAVRQRTEELFTSQPDIVQATVLAAK